MGNARTARQILDQRLGRIRPLIQEARPAHGWIRAIREALGMSTGQLAQRLGIAQPTVVALEQSEKRGSVRLDKLRRAADALNCDLVYVLVPRQKLQDIVAGRALDLARRNLARVQHSMALESQAVARQETEGQLRQHAARLEEHPRLWDDK